MSEILVFPRAWFAQLPDAGAWAVDDWPDRHVWMERAQAESDERWLQPIPYVLIADGAEVWCYRRDGGDRRLDGRLSCGVGGHVERCDQRETPRQSILAGAGRELEEEIIRVAAWGPLVPRAFLYEGRSAVGRVHLGVVFVVDPGDREFAARDGEALQPLGFLRADRIGGDERFELWSRLAAALVADA